MAARAASYSYICQPVDYSDDPNEVRVRAHTHTNPHMCPVIVRNQTAPLQQHNMFHR